MAGHKIFVSVTPAAVITYQVNLLESWLWAWIYITLQSNFMFIVRVVAQWLDGLGSKLIDF